MNHKRAIAPRVTARMTIHARKRKQPANYRGHPSSQTLMQAREPFSENFAVDTDELEFTDYFTFTIGSAKSVPIEKAFGLRISAG